MPSALMRCLLGSMAFGLATAAPQLAARSPREIAGIPLAKSVLAAKSIELSATQATARAQSKHPQSLAQSSRPGVSSVEAPSTENVSLAEVAANQIEYLVETKINGDAYDLIIDTGATDTWVFSSDFKCFDPLSGRPAELEVCDLGPLFKGEVEEVEGVVLDLDFGPDIGNGPYITGTFGLADIDVAGLTLKDQQLGLATEGAWHGDAVSSGILGLGFANSTGSRNEEKEAAVYDTIFKSMVKDGLEPMFSLALSRNKSESYIAFGGIPDIKTGEFATTDIITEFVDPLENAKWGGRYMMQFDSITWNTTGDVRSGKTNESPVPVPFLLDSGTSLNVFPDQFALFTNQLFTPPAVFDETEFLFFVPCNAVAPTITFEIGGVSIRADPASLIFPEVKKNGRCATGVTVSRPYDESDIPMFVLGDTFLQELVVLFDLGEKMQVHIAERA